MLIQPIGDIPRDNQHQHGCPRPEPFAPGEPNALVAMAGIGKPLRSGASTLTDKPRRHDLNLGS